VGPAVKNKEQPGVTSEIQLGDGASG